MDGTWGLGRVGLRQDWTEGEDAGEEEEEEEEAYRPCRNGECFISPQICCQLPDLHVDLSPPTLLRHWARFFFNGGTSYCA